VDKYVTTPISELLLNESIGNGDVVDVRMENGQLVVRKGAPVAQSSEVN